MSGLSDRDETRISVLTIRKLLSTFESLFLIRLIETEGSERKPVIFFEDQGEATYLTGGVENELGDLTRFLFSQLRTQYAYRPQEKIRAFQFRNRGGALVSLCKRSKVVILHRGHNDRVLAPDLRVLGLVDSFRENLARTPEARTRLLAL